MQSRRGIRGGHPRINHIEFFPQIWHELRGNSVSYRRFRNRLKTALMALLSKIALAVLHVNVCSNAPREQWKRMLKSKASKSSNFLYLM